MFEVSDSLISSGWMFSIRLFVKYFVEMGTLRKKARCSAFILSFVEIFSFICVLVRLFPSKIICSHEVNDETNVNRHIEAFLKGTFKRVFKRVTCRINRDVRKTNWANLLQQQ